MTYQYSDIDPLESMYNLARRFPGGIEGLAVALGRRMGKHVVPSVLRNKLRPGIQTHFLTAEEFDHIMDLGEEAGVERAKAPLQALNYRHGLVAVDMSQVAVSGRDILGKLATVSKEFAELVAEVTKDAADGKVTGRECERICKEALEVMQAAMALSMSAEIAAGKREVAAE